MRYGQASDTKAMQQTIQLNINSQSFDLTLSFAAGQSLLLRASPTRVELVPIEFDSITH